MKGETPTEVEDKLIKPNSHGATFLEIEIRAVDVVEVQTLIFLSQEVSKLTNDNHCFSNQVECRNKQVGFNVSSKTNCKPFSVRL